MEVGQREIQGWGAGRTNNIEQREVRQAEVMFQEQCDRTRKKYNEGESILENKNPYKWDLR